MTAVHSGPPNSPPDGRYGPGDRRFTADADARADRKLKIAAIVLGALTVLGVGWYGWHSLTGDRISAQVVAFKAVSDQSLEIHLEVHKGAGTVAVCTVRSVDEDHNEVGRKDVRIDRHARQVDTVVTLRTTARGSTGELLGCQAVSRG
ncbi:MULTISPECIES: DUF4307 domain-containing protein [unclassified Streptomyces]|uniref:DUF4307 domain-containing protein n=1 Tax=unclassified Streptomyces TaxID=2593676 RepID=UPI002E2E0652|nr:DUF4307 domain-containing protein [Streptomyces sp. NBC_00223]